MYPRWNLTLRNVHQEDPLCKETRGEGRTKRKRAGVVATRCRLDGRYLVDPLSSERSLLGSREKKREREERSEHR